MVYVSASHLCLTPKENWKQWTKNARTLAKRCKESAAKWRQAEQDAPVLALWAASFKTCARARGQWVLESESQRRMWLDDLQGKPPRYAN